jgi:Tol biopolymer transport system component
MPDAWSPDGKYILYMPEHHSAICYIARISGGTWKAPPCREQPFLDMAGQFSPDGRLLAYCSNESGRPEVWVRPFPYTGEKWRVSRTGGTQPRWSRKGNELYYVQVATLFRVKISTRPIFSSSVPVRLFSDPALNWEYWHPTYDVSADGKKFVMTEPSGDARKPVLRVVQNWFSEFRERSKAR